MDGCNYNPGSASTTGIRNEDGAKHVTDIILTLVWIGFWEVKIRMIKF